MATEAGVPTAQSSEDEGNDTSPNKSYVYPGSSVHNDAKESEQSSPGQQRRTSRQNSSDSDGIPLAPPVHQFVPHSPNIYDSDASDNRCVLLNIHGCIFRASDDSRISFLPAPVALSLTIQALLPIPLTIIRSVIAETDFLVSIVWPVQDPFV